MIRSSLKENELGLFQLGYAALNTGVFSMVPAAYIEAYKSVQLSMKPVSRLDMTSDDEFFESDSDSLDKTPTGPKPVKQMIEDEPEETISTPSLTHFTRFLFVTFILTLFTSAFVTFALKWTINGYELIGFILTSISGIYQLRRRIWTGEPMFDKHDKLVKELFQNIYFIAFLSIFMLSNPLEISIIFVVLFGVYYIFMRAHYSPGIGIIFALQLGWLYLLFTKTSPEKWSAQARLLKILDGFRSFLLLFTIVYMQIQNDIHSQRCESGIFDVPMSMNSFEDYIKAVEYLHSEFRYWSFLDSRAFPVFCILFQCKSIISGVSRMSVVKDLFDLKTKVAITGWLFLIFDIHSCTPACLYPCKHHNVLSTINLVRLISVIINLVKFLAPNLFRFSYVVGTLIGSCIPSFGADPNIVWDLIQRQLYCFLRLLALTLAFRGVPNSYHVKSLLHELLEAGPLNMFRMRSTSTILTWRTLFILYAFCYMGIRSFEFSTTFESYFRF